MRNQDLILVARKARVVTRLRNTIGLIRAKAAASWVSRISRVTSSAS
jgi:ethanolamine ammonia-lyase large subunit